MIDRIFWGFVAVAVVYFIVCVLMYRDQKETDKYFEEALSGPDWEADEIEGRKQEDQKTGE